MGYTNQKNVYSPKEQQGHYPQTFGPNSAMTAKPGCYEPVSVVVPDVNQKDKISKSQQMKKEGKKRLSKC